MLGSTRCPVPLTFNPASDDPNLVATAFCQEHGLNVQQVAPAVAAQILSLAHTTHSVVEHEKSLNQHIEELYNQLAAGGPHEDLLKSQKSKHDKAESVLQSQLVECRSQLATARTTIQQRDATIYHMQKKIHPPCKFPKIVSEIGF